MIEKIADLLMKNAYLAKRIDRKTVPQFIKYLVVGFSSSSIELVLFYALYKFLPSIMADSLSVTLLGTLILIPHMITLCSNTFAYTIVFVYNYTLQRKWAFQSTANVKKQMVLYTLLFGFNLVVSNYLVIFLINFLRNICFNGMQTLWILPISMETFIPLLAKVLSIAFVVSWNFVIYKKIIFKK